MYVVPPVVIGFFVGVVIGLIILAIVSMSNGD